MKPSDQNPPQAGTTPGSLPQQGSELELSTIQVKQIIHDTIPYLEQFLSSINEQDSCQGVDSGDRSGLAVSHAPADINSTLDQLFSTVVPSGYNTTSPGFMGFFGGGGLPQAAIADLIAGVVNRFTGRWASAPSAVELELSVIRWITQMAGYPATAMGLLTSGGSQSNLIALFTARESYAGKLDMGKARIYVSDQAHFSIRIAAKMCGFPPHAIREVETCALGTMQSSQLHQFIDEDKKKGWQPACIVATAGTFITGAVDDIGAIAAIAQQEQLWLHLDAAYGGFFNLAESGKPILAAMSECDSITLDPHKSLFMPYGTGALLVKDGAKLKHAHDIDADFYGPLQDQGERVDFCSYTFEQSRPWRGLRIWLPLKLHGVAPFQAMLEEKLQLARYAARHLAGIAAIELLAPPTLSVLVFRFYQPGLSHQQLTSLNKRLLETINSRNAVFLMGTQVKGNFGIRLCVLSFRTHLSHVQTALDEIERLAVELRDESSMQAGA